MDRDHSRSNVWPYRQYDGGDRYEEYVVDKDTWIIEKGFKKHLGRTVHFLPKTIP